MNSFKGEEYFYFTELCVSKHPVSAKLVDGFVDDLLVGQATNSKLRMVMKYILLNLCKSHKTGKDVLFPQSRGYYSSILKEVEGKKKRQYREKCFFFSHANMKICMAILEMNQLLVKLPHIHFLNDENGPWGLCTRIRPTDIFIKKCYGIDGDEIMLDDSKLKLVELNDEVNEKKVEVIWTTDDLGRDAKKFVTDRQKFLEKQNELIANTNITIDGAKLNNNILVSVFCRGLTNLFTKGGRFYAKSPTGCTYMSVKKELRKTIKFNNEETVELDYKCLHPHMIFAMENKQLDFDPYIFTDYDRKFVKVLINIAINHNNYNTITKALRYYMAKHKDAVGQMFKWSYERFMLDSKVNLEKLTIHFKNYIGSDYGVRLQYLDSCIAQDVMMYFQSKGIVVLPVHDSFIIAKQYKDELTNVMKSVYFKHMGHTIDIG